MKKVKQQIFVKMRVLIQYDFEIRFPISRVKAAIENINYTEELECNNLKDLLDALNQKYTISQDTLDFRICSQNYDLIVKGNFCGNENSQDRFFELIAPYVRDIEIFVIITSGERETILVKWTINDGVFNIVNYYLENIYDEGDNDIPEMDDNELFTLLEDFGLDFEHVLDIMQHQNNIDESKEKSVEEKEMEISEDSEDEFEFPDILEAVSYFIRKNTYPSYSIMNNRINNEQYTEHIHILCKRLYENITENEFIKSQLESILQQYGELGLNLVKKVLEDYSPLKNSLKSRIRNYPKNVLNL